MPSDTSLDDLFEQVPSANNRSAEIIPFGKPSCLDGDNQSVALDLARRGFKVFPITLKRDGDWTPIPGWQAEATSESAQIKSWFTQYPDARVGLPCGAANGCAVLDVDMKKGKDGLASLAAMGLSLDSTPVRVKTPSGGWHLFFGNDDRLRNSVGKLGAGLDVRTAGGYVVAPGSRKAGSLYEPQGQALGDASLPPWPVEASGAFVTETAPVEPLDKSTDEQRQWAADQLARKVAGFEAITEEGNGRNAMLNNLAMWAGGAAAHGFLDRNQVVAELERAAVANGHASGKLGGVRATIRAGFNAGLKNPITKYPLEYDFDDLPAPSPTDISDLFDPPELPAPPPTRKEIVRKRMSENYHRNEDGDLIINLHNAILLLGKIDRDENLNIRNNSMSGLDEYAAGVIEDKDLIALRVYLQQHGLKRVGKSDAADAVEIVAASRQYHPVRDYLNGLQHDGVARLDTWLSDYMTVDDTPYVRAVGRAFLIAMVARVMQPGCKHDHVLVLSGKQGMGKSTACRVLAGADYFSESMPAIKGESLEARRHLPGKWLIELGELQQTRKSEVEEFRTFISGHVDNFRLPYGKKDKAHPRQCVFVGTTNSDAYLSDPEGERRIWPVDCKGEVDVNGLSSARDQLFAEAHAAFKAGEAWHLTREMAEIAKGEQLKVREEHPWESAIRRALDGLSDGDGFDECTVQRDSVTIPEVLTLLEVPVERQHAGNARQVSAILKGLGWTRKHTRNGKTWHRPA